ALLRQGLGAAGLRALAASALLFVAVVSSMAWLTTQRAPWTSVQQDIANRVAYEHRYARLQAAPQPSITHVALNVALEPNAARATVRGTLRLTNSSGRRGRYVVGHLPAGAHACPLRRAAPIDRTGSGRHATSRVRAGAGFCAL